MLWFSEVGFGEVWSGREKAWGKPRVFYLLSALSVTIRIIFIANIIFKNGTFQELIISTLVDISNEESIPAGGIEIVRGEKDSLKISNWN